MNSQISQQFYLHMEGQLFHNDWKLKGQQRAQKKKEKPKLALLLGYLCYFLGELVNEASKKII